MYSDSFSIDPVHALIAQWLTFHLLALVVYIPYLITLQRALQQIAPENRQIQPGQVWLSLIPGFRLFWCFLVVARLGDSLHDELNRRNRLEFDDRPAGSIGIAMAILSLAFHLATTSDAVPLISLLFLAMITCWIIYWTKIAGYSAKMKQSGPWHFFLPETQFLNKQSATAAAAIENSSTALYSLSSSANSTTPQQGNPEQNTNDLSRWKRPENK